MNEYEDRCLGNFRAYVDEDERFVVGMIKDGKQVVSLAKQWKASRSNKLRSSSDRRVKIAYVCIV